VLNAPKAMQQFIQQLEELKRILEEFKNITDNMDEREIFGDGLSSLLAMDDSKDYRDLLEHVRKKLLSNMSGGALMTKFKRMTWPFSSEKTLEMVETLHRHLQIYQAAIQIDSLLIIPPRNLGCLLIV
jgi:hypothetical protein